MASQLLSFEALHREVFLWTFATLAMLRMFHPHAEPLTRFCGLELQGIEGRQ